MKINITKKTNPNKILNYFKKCGLNDSINLKTDFGFIYLIGGILSKLEGTKHYIANKGKWVKLC